MRTSIIIWLYLFGAIFERHWNVNVSNISDKITFLLVMSLIFAIVQDIKEILKK